MAKMTIIATATSISVYDSSNNRVAIRQSQATNFNKAVLIPEYSIQENKTLNEGYKLGAAILTYLRRKSKDNFQKRFKKLQVLLTSFDVHSFEVLKNRLNAHIEPKPVKQEQPAEELATLEVEA